MIADKKSNAHAELVAAFDEKELIRKERDRVEKKGKEVPDRIGRLKCCLASN